jgi:uncharacterized protein (TIGR02186 family)
MAPSRPDWRPSALCGWVLLLAAVFAGPARADDVLADLSTHIIAIGSGFTGDQVVLFGATDGPGDIVAVVRGPDRELTVWRKGKVAGIWVNAESVTFRNVPSFYAIAASRPPDDLMSPATAALYRVGLGNLKLEPSEAVAPDRAKRFADALIQQQQLAGLFGSATIKIAFLGERLFRASLDFPANVPTGAYLVQIYLVRDRDIVGGQTTPLIVSKVGVDAALSDFATREAAAYGAIAVLVAVVAGWLASLPFRGV